MSGRLPPHIWFVRSNRGSGSYPIAPEGRRTMWNFVAGLAASTIVGGLLAVSGSKWFWPVVLTGTAGAAIWFIATARQHTDFSITDNDYVKDKKNA
jgi:hypothetical protein